MFRDRQGFMQGMNMYVPAMQYASSLNANEGNIVTLGRPLAAGGPVTINMPANAPGYQEAGAFIDLAFAKIVAPDLTDPATAVSGDPRGQYIPTAAPDGVKEYIICLRPDGGINANNNGGLHGIRQYNA
jgi:hypothetical protein